MRLFKTKMEILSAVGELSERINVDFMASNKQEATIDGKYGTWHFASGGPAIDLDVVVVMKGGMFFAADLLRGLDFNVRLHTITIDRYSPDSPTIHLSAELERLSYQMFKNGGKVRIENMLIVEDIVDTGETITQIKEYLNRHFIFGRMCIASLIARDQKAAELVDYMCFMAAGKEFFHGYGLDDCGLRRNLPYIVESDKELSARYSL